MGGHRPWREIKHESGASQAAVTLLNGVRAGNEMVVVDAQADLAAVAELVRERAAAEGLRVVVKVSGNTVSAQLE